MENKKPISDEELQRLADWLKSDEGRKKIRESQETADEVCKIIDSMNNISPELLHTPFGQSKINWEAEVKAVVNDKNYDYKRSYLEYLESLKRAFRKTPKEKCECDVKTNVELRADGKRYCGECGKLYE